MLLVYLQGLLFVVELIVLGRLNEVAVVAALFKLHHDVEKARRAALCAFTKSFVVSG